MRIVNKILFVLMAASFLTLYVLTAFALLFHQQETALGCFGLAMLAGAVAAYTESRR